MIFLSDFIANCNVIYDPGNIELWAYQEWRNEEQILAHEPAFACVDTHVIVSQSWTSKCGEHWKATGTASLQAPWVVSGPVRWMDL